jgi:hypothetical protein
MNRKYFGLTIFCLGLIVAITSASKVPAEGQQWPDTILSFILGTIACLAGLYLWRKSVKVEAAQIAGHSDENSRSAKEELEMTLQFLEKLAPRVGQLSTHQLCDEIDDCFGQHLNAFTEKRSQVIDSLGMEKGADILVTVAFGERMLNRVWSAASDDHIEEARSVFPDALDAFKESVEKINQP